MAHAAPVIDVTVDRLVRRVIDPLTSVIPFLVRTGLLLAVFAVAWIACLAAFVLRPDLLAEAWRVVTSWPLIVQAGAWLLFLPPLAGLWISQTDWPPLVSGALMAVLAGWNLLVLRPGTAASDDTKA
jgi:hypothetical protein